MARTQLDNSTFEKKAALRSAALMRVKDPVILETHGGYGRIWGRCYHHVESGVVFEKDKVKTEKLARQRPTWAVYEADCLKALEHGVGAHLPVNFVDFDPYGEVWPAIEAFFKGFRPDVDRLVFTVHDGLRMKLRTQSGWEVESLERMVRKYGNAQLFDRYKEIAQELLKEKAEAAGYSLAGWTAYYCGNDLNMLHFAAELKRNAFRLFTN